LILAATEVVQGRLGKPLLLLLDDPSAELDQASVRRLMAVIAQLGSQVIATTLEAHGDLFDRPPRLFHVEHGIVSAAV
jgi:recombinational DNA repair ATPase RecF